MNKLTPRISLFIALLLVTVPSQAPAQEDFNAAKKHYKRNIRSDKLSERRAAVRRLRNTSDERAVKEFLVQIHKCRKEAAKIEKKANPIVKKLAENRAEFDKRLSAYLKQNPGTKTYPKGLVGQLPEKIDELTQKVAPYDRDLRLEESTLSILKTAIGDLITGLDEAAQLEATNLFIAQYEKLRKPDQRALYLDILGHVHNPQAVIGLVGIATTAADSASRISALEALQRLGDHRGGKAARFALADEHWSVRAAAVQAARSFASVDMIPALIDRLEKEKGRLRGDIIETLSLLAGVSYSDNVILWKRWWKENEKELREIVKQLDSDNVAEQSAGLQKMEAQGFLLAARRMLEKRQLTTALIDAEEARRMVDPTPGKPAPKAADGDDDVLESVGKTIGERDKPIREAAFRALVLNPFNRTWNPERRRDLITLMGHVGTKDASNILAGLMRKPSDEAKDTFERRVKRRERDGRLSGQYRYDPAERVHAVRALAHCPHGGDQVMTQLRRLFREDDKEPEMLLAAVRAYESIDTSDSVKALIKALGELVSQDAAGREKTAGVEKAITDALRKVTRQEIGESHDDWVAWWGTAQNDFKTDTEKALEKDPQTVAGNAEEGGTRFYGIKTYSKRICFVLDISGSMNEPAEYGGQDKTKIQVAKAELVNAISSLPKDALFNIVFYSTDYRVWQKRLVTADAKIKKAAKTDIADLQADGGTNIYDPLVKVFDIAGRGTRDEGYKEVALDTIFFLSDGQPTAGRVMNPEDILNKILALNSLRKIKIHTIGVGRNHDRQFMKNLADRSGGRYVAR